MPGLLNPLHDSTPSISQAFTGHDVREPFGWLRSDSAGPLYAFPGLLPHALARPFTHLHMAIDEICPIGTPIRAPETMKIVLATVDGPTGDFLVRGEIRPGTVFQVDHLSKMLVREGDIVKRGEDFCLSGDSGHVTGPHMHGQLMHDPKDTNWLNSWKWPRWNWWRFLVGRDYAATPWILPSH